MKKKMPFKPNFFTVTQKFPNFAYFYELLYYIAIDCQDSRFVMKKYSKFLEQIIAGFCLQFRTNP